MDVDLLLCQLTRDKLNLAEHREDTFPFGGLPVELQRKIVLPIAQESWSAYKSLNLTCHRTRQLACAEEVVPFHPIVLTHEYQLVSFYELISSPDHKELANLVRSLWIITDAGKKASESFGNQILQLCTNLVSLGCKNEHIPPTSIKHLTLLEGSRTWMSHFEKLADSLEGLHLITGSGGRRHELAMHSRIHFHDISASTMPALQEASFSVGKDSRYFIDSHHLSVVADKAPKLRRVMMFTRSGRSGSVDDGQIERMRSGADWIFGHQTQVKWSVHRCPRRLTEAKLWEKRILDGGMDWKI